MKNKKFHIPQIEVNEKEETKQPETQPSSYQREPFVSSVFGTRVKDEITFSGAQFGNRGKQYDAFRDKDKKIIKDDYKDYITYQETTDNQTQRAKAHAVQSDESKPKPVSSSRPIYEIEEENEDDEVLQPELDDIYIEFEEDEDEIEPLEEYGDDSTEKKNNPPVKKRLDVKKAKKNAYMAPPLSLLKKGKSIRKNDLSGVHFQREKINSTLQEFDIAGEVVHFTYGPAVTQFEVQLDSGVRVQKVKNIASNLMASLKARSIRIQAPIPGKSTIGIEVPNTITDLVYFGELLQNDVFINDGNPMNVVLGLDLGGNPVYVNLAKTPHCLIGGTTGSGKSVCINAMITSILYKAHPDDVKLILIDPKIIEFSNYEDMPHLATPVITEPKVATAALRWAVEEMQNRYQLFRAVRAREFEEYNKIAASSSDISHLPYIVIVIDELADLMLISGNDVEDYIQRLTQKGRASGIHLIVATQRPSVDVIKGTIKTNIPTRIAFQVKTQVDSSIILDHSGAEKLLGQGDMLYNDSVSEHRIQGAFISAEEIIKVTNYIRNHSDARFIFTEKELIDKIEGDNTQEGINDEYFAAVARFVVENSSASINRIQKTFNIGFNRAQAIMIGLEDLGIVSQNLGSRAREVEVNLEQLEGILEDL